MITAATLKRWGKGNALVLPDTLVKEAGPAIGNQASINPAGQKIGIRNSAASQEIGKLCEAVATGNLDAETTWRARGVTCAAKASGAVMEKATQTIVSLIGRP